MDYGVFLLTLDIINPTGIGIDLPNDLLSEVAFSANSTYFILQAKYPKLTGVPEAEVSYGSCTNYAPYPQRYTSFYISD